MEQVRRADVKSDQKRMIKIIPDDFNPTEFNEVSVNPVQSWEWGESKRALGIKVLRIGEFKGDTLQHVNQMTFHKIPYTHYTIGYVPRSEFPTQDALEFIKDIAKKEQAIFVKLEPYIKKQDFKHAIPAGLVTSSHPLFPAWTQMLDLAPSEEILLKNCKSKTRYNIKLAQKKGVVVREESNDKGFETFAKLYFETTKRQKYHGHNHHYHKIVWESMKKNIAHILIAYYENTPLAAYELFHFNDVLYYPYGGTSDLHRNLMASNLIMWETILLGKKLGAKTFDMWGSLPASYDQKNPWSGFTRFKEGYGTEFVEFVGSYDLVINSTLYKLYNTAHKFRGIFLKLRV